MTSKLLLFLSLAVEDFSITAPRKESADFLRNFSLSVHFTVRFNQLL